MHKVLIIEDDQETQELYRDILKISDPTHRITLLMASTQPDAEMLFSDNPDISVIIFDGNVPGGKEKTTLALITKFRQSFKGPMIATSNDEKLQKIMVEIGCSHRSPKGMSLFKLLMLVLDLN